MAPEVDLRVFQHPAQSLPIWTLMTSKCPPFLNFVISQECSWRYRAILLISPSSVSLVSTCTCTPLGRKLDVGPVLGQGEVALAAKPRNPFASCGFKHASSSLSFSDSSWMLGVPNPFGILSNPRPEPDFLNMLCIGPVNRCSPPPRPTCD